MAEKNFIYRQSSFLTILFALVVTGCGKDMTANESNAAKNIADQAQTERVAGSYAGVLYSAADGKPLGAFRVELSADTQIENGDQSSAVSAQLTLNDGHSENTIHMADGRYNLVNHRFRIETSILHTKTISIKVALAGVIDGNSMAGKVEAQNFPEYGGTFLLMKEADLPGVVVPERPFDRGTNTRAETFRGSATTDENRQFETLLVYTPAIRNADQRFLDVFYPIRAGNVAIHFDGDALVMAFPNTAWDMRTRTLTGISSGGFSGENPYSITLNCRESDSGGIPGWQCDWNGTRRISLNVSST